MNSLAYWPFPTNLKIPLLVIYGANDTAINNNMNIFQNLVKEYKIPFQFLIFPKIYADLGEKRKDALDAISAFLISC